MRKLFGNTSGLKANQTRKLQNIYQRRVPVESVITHELARDICHISHDIRRQIGLLINRQGRIESVIIGDHQGIVIPDVSEYRTAPGRLKGLRCVHTHLSKEELTNDDLTDLSLLRLDLIAAITITDDGFPFQVHIAHVLPGKTQGVPYQILPATVSTKTDIQCLELVMALESELARVNDILKADKGVERALLVSVSTAPRHKALQSLAELEELAVSGNIKVIDTIIQQRARIDSRTLMGKGKINEIIILALQKAVTLIVFDQELNPSQMRVITDKVELKVIDRTQLILDIFAQRALSREGKLQVELAQLKYLLPRLIFKNTAMSRLTGGIGGRGPGETKLEINRRRVRDRIAKLEKELKSVQKQRKQQRARRSKKGLPIISIIGYTNAGKSTLLNTLTQSNVLAERRLFATLDPSSRRLKFPRDIEVIITDTVGFINDLPKELMVAFRATLEELENADVLLHVIDISNPRVLDQILSVERIISELNLQTIPVINVLNKQDLTDSRTVEKYRKRFKGSVSIAAIDASTLMPLIEKMSEIIEPIAG